MMAHRDLPVTLLVCDLKEDASPVAGTDVAVVVLRGCGGKLGLVDNPEVYVQITEVFLKTLS